MDNYYSTSKGNVRLNNTQSDEPEEWNFTQYLIFISYYLCRFEKIHQKINRFIK